MIVKAALFAAVLTAAGWQQAPTLLFGSRADCEAAKGHAAAAYRQDPAVSFVRVVCIDLPAAKPI